MECTKGWADAIFEWMYYDFTLPTAQSSIINGAEKVDFYLVRPTLCSLPKTEVQNDIAGWCRYIFSPGAESGV